MILPIYAFGTSALRSKTKPVDMNVSSLKPLIQDMFETVQHVNGVGLAAPQVGKLIRFFIVDTSPFKDDNKYNAEEKKYLSTFKRVFINPVVIEQTGEDWGYEEGCLSIPHIHEEVFRKSIVKIEYYDETFTKKVETFDGIICRIILHEYDHINGILFTDRLSAFKRRLLKKKLNDILNGKVDKDYKMVFK